MDETEVSQQTATMQNVQMMAAANNLVQYRLDTEPELARIYSFISGTSRMYDEKEDKTVTMEIAKPKANNIGVHGIMNFISMFMNKHVIMGNLKEEHYKNFMSRIRLEFTYEIIRNRYRYGITEEDSQSLIDFIISQLELYLTRPINDGERESFKTQYKTSEVISTSDKKPNTMESYAQGFGK